MSTRKYSVGEKALTNIMKEDVMDRATSKVVAEQLATLRLDQLQHLVKTLQETMLSELDKMKGGTGKGKGKLDVEPKQQLTSGASDIPASKKSKKGSKKGGEGKAKRRMAVTGDNADEADADDDSAASAPVSQISSSERDRIFLAMQTNLLFSSLEQQIIDTVMDAMEHVAVAAGTVLMKQGDPGDYFYAVDSGKFDVAKDGAVVATLQYPAVFGELALMYSAPRAATIRVAEAGAVYRVGQKAFKNALVNSKTAKMQRFLRTVPVLEALTEHALLDLAPQLEVQEVRPGKYVAVQVDAFYIVFRGEVLVTPSSSTRPPTKDKQDPPKYLGPRSFFGDKELLSGERGDMYTAADDGGRCTVLVMNKDLFFAKLHLLEQPIYDTLKYQTLRSLPLLNDVTDDQITAVADLFQTDTFLPGQCIIQQGRKGEKFFILLKGRVKVAVNGREVARLPVYSYFGERSLLSDDLTAADVVALEEEVTVLYLQREAFDVLLGPLKEIIARQNKIRMLKGVTILESLSDKELEALSDALTIVEYEDREPIITEGDAGNTFFMVKSGVAVVTKADLPGQELARLEKGDFFGERALLDDAPRAATVTATGPVECFAVDRSDFNRHLGSLKDLMEAHQNKQSQMQENKEIRLEMLEKKAVLGKGAFGLVTLELFEGRDSMRTFALKAVKKEFVVEHGQQPQLQRELHCLRQADSGFIMKLVKTFVDAHFVYFLTEPLLGGELWSYIAHEGAFSEPRAMFCGACVLAGLAHLHSLGIIYRDLKLENLMLDEHGYVKIVDFGFAKKLSRNEYTYTVCGTPEYMAPEVLRGTGHNKGADYWSLGILIYELLHGYTPFAAENDTVLLSNIISGMFHFERGSKAVRELVRQLLNRDVKLRLGCTKTGAAGVMQHPWFAQMDWLGLEKGTLEAPFVPEIEDALDVSNFDQDIDDEDQGTPRSVTDKVLDAAFKESY